MARRTNPLMAVLGAVGDGANVLGMGAEMGCNFIELKLADQRATHEYLEANRDSRIEQKIAFMNMERERQVHQLNDDDKAEYDAQVLKIREQVKALRESKANNTNKR